MTTKVTKDGFVWLEVSARHANDIWKAKYATLYVLHDDDSETMIETDRQIGHAMCDGKHIGVEVGSIKDLLPSCPTCGSKLIPSRHDGYDWECLECDSDFVASEI